MRQKVKWQLVVELSNCLFHPLSRMGYWESMRWFYLIRSGCCGLDCQTVPSRRREVEERKKERCGWPWGAI